MVGCCCRGLMQVGTWGWSNFCYKPAKYSLTYDIRIRLIDHQYFSGFSHGYFNSYLERIPSSEVKSPHCTCGRKHQTPEHLLYCSLYKKERKEMARSLKPIPLTKTTVLHTRKGIKVLMTCNLQMLPLDSGS